jgi:hypothetical protein
MQLLLLSSDLLLECNMIIKPQLWELCYSEEKLLLMIHFELRYRKIGLLILLKLFSCQDIFFGQARYHEKETEQNPFL